MSLFLPIVPPFFAVFLLLPVILILLKSGWLFYAGVAAFFSCFIWQFNAYQSAQQDLLQSQQRLTGVISTTPQHYAEYSQFRLRLDSGAAAGYYVQLNWSAPPQPLQQGQRWQLSARLRPVAGVANPVGVNKEAAALLNNVLAQGTVLPLPDTVLLNQQPGLRAYWLDKVSAAVAPLPSAPLLLALTMGERQFSPALWQGLQLSGLAHLVAISGLHIGLVFGWTLVLLRIVPWPIAYLTWHRPVALIGAMLLSCGYAWLAGFAVPTIRATVALLLLVAAALQHKSLSYLSYWLLLSAVLLLAEPFFVLSKSFWLSLLAVAVIFFVLWRQPLTNVNWRSRLTLFFLFHLSLTVFMSLLSLLFFDGSAGLSLVSNLLFVPWCSLLAIPVLLLCLLAELLGIPGSNLVWQLCDGLFQPLLWWLNWCAEHGSWWGLPDMSVALLLGFMLLAILYRLASLRILLFMLPLLMLPLLQQWLKPPEWQLHLIDVGQGLAVLLQRGDRGLMYDAGPRFGGYSATAAQVLPFLRQRGVRHLDYLLLSHDDSDHTGNWQLLQQAYPQLKIYTDIADISAAQPCRQLPAQYFQAQLTVLHSGGAGSKNDGSCVVLLSVQGWTILLPGDISQHVELQLLQRYPTLSANVLVLAHHGSGSSSHFRFLHQLAPQLALNSASLYNRHRHPAEPVQQRLATLGIPLLNTAQSGAITVDISATALELTEYRRQRIPFWLQKPLGNAETLVTTR
ncbi:MAG TPA: DNA internalization-related competence protein ComEC/Rec2 [Rheinheimera sp.]|nr:DNA internalization-related competence protein ComEC/Rec2 [Rheinheimera sp.]